jgi:hypothetical protein
MIDHVPSCGRIRFSAYGSSYYAFVYAKNMVVIYRPSDKEIVGVQDFTEEFKKSGLDFTSIIIVENLIYIGLSNGEIFSFFQKAGQHEFVYTRFKKRRVHGYAPFTRHKEAVHLLGGNAKTLVYHTSKQVYFSSLGPHTLFTIDDPIIKYAFNDSENLLLLATKHGDNVHLHRVKPKQEPSSIQLEFPEGYKDWEPLAISKGGNVACSSDGNFVICNPFRGQGPSEPFNIGRSWDNQEGQGCFMGENFFVYCGQESPEIAVAYSENGDWKDISELQAPELNEAISGLDPVISGWTFESQNGVLVENPTYDGKDLVVTIRGKDYLDDDQGLIVFKADKKHGLY